MLGERIASRLTVLRLICDQVVPQVLACAVESSVILLTLSLHHYIDDLLKGEGGAAERQSRQRLGGPSGKASSKFPPFCLAQTLSADHIRLCIWNFQPVFSAN